MALLAAANPAQAQAQQAAETASPETASAETAGADAAAPGAPPSRAPATIWQIGSGVSYSTGDYGGPVSTDLVAVPLNLRVSRGGWSLRVATSFLVIDGPASLADVLDGQPAADGADGAPASTSTRSGMSDLSFTLARRLDLSQTTRLTADVRLKLPTGSEAERLTTGTTDVTLRARLAQEIGDLTLNAGLQRRFAGGQGRTLLRDTWGASAGASLDLGSRVVGGVDLDWRQSAYPAGTASTSLTAYVSAPLNRRIRLTGYVSPGLSTNSADLTIGTSITIRID